MDSVMKELGGMPPRIFGLEPPLNVSGVFILLVCDFLP